MSKQWIRCRIEKGMFSDEVVVVVKTQSGEQAAFFVPRTEIGESPVGKVRVQTFGGNSWAVLPDAAQTLVPVDQSEFIAA